jgi:prepilin-type N-terminal cleavage/methylation domain-containing protein
VKTGGCWRRSAGMTLVELLLVLAILAAVAALTWPVVTKSFAGYRLRSAADTVRAKWCLMRVEAIRSGHTHSFRYTVAGARFRTEQYADLDSIVPARAELSSGSGVQTDAVATTATPAAQHDEWALPEGIVFFTADTADSPVDADDSSLSLPGEADWSDPILFRPDGTTSDAHLGLKNDRGAMMELTLRGLTGMVAVSDILDSQR